MFVSKGAKLGGALPCPVGVILANGSSGNGNGVPAVDTPFNFEA